MLSLNDKNFGLFAARNYNNSEATSITEFHRDLNRIGYVKRLIKQYVNGDRELPDRLILNQLIVLINVFGMRATTILLINKIDKPEYLSVLKPFLIYLQCVDYTFMDEISLDSYAVDRLRNL